MSHSSYQSIPGLTVPSFFCFRLFHSIPLSFSLPPFILSIFNPFHHLSSFYSLLLFSSHPPPLFLHLMYSFLLLYFLSHSFLFLPPLSSSSFLGDL